MPTEVGKESFGLDFYSVELFIEIQKLFFGKLDSQHGDHGSDPEDCEGAYHGHGVFIDHRRLVAFPLLLHTLGFLHQQQAEDNLTPHSPQDITDLGIEGAVPLPFSNIKPVEDSALLLQPIAFIENVHLVDFRLVSVITIDSFNYSPSFVWNLELEEVVFGSLCFKLLSIQKQSDFRKV